MPIYKVLYGIYVILVILCVFNCLFILSPYKLLFFVDDYRKTIWPLLVGVTKEEMTEPPSLDDLSTHPEYNQVWFDQNLISQPFVIFITFFFVLT